MHTFPWAALPAIAGDLLAVMFVTISTLLLNTTGIEIATRVEANIERDLKVLGIANMVSGSIRRLCELHLVEPLHSRSHAPARPAAWRD